MNKQKSFEDKGPAGILYVVPTPIGNLEDITIRGLNTLKSVDLIAAEDTRNTKKLLTHFDIHCSMVSYHEHSQDSRVAHLISQLKNGKDVALVSDAGMPAISDPGAPLIQAVLAEELSVVVLPGANAALCALVGSGLATDQFYFFGFLPRKNKERKRALQRLQRQNSTVILYESPYRLTETLEDIHFYLGNRQIAIARELTKRFEEYVRGTIEEVMNWTKTGTIKGEFCIVIEGNPEESDNQEEAWWEKLTINQHVDYYIEKDQLSSKMAIKQVAEDRKISKRDVYQSYHVE
ncbi:16S rRNA (cytidine(1402)-2'-O)-methyltransferase [Amphibacillus sediminis]|uniref:16S rRNA (cytidine(1402)-2'-O)-methyltransferase n=1 Tax=Amphibacillus sediminis TaxID=360185 RepID=UPI00082A9B28|nr:16S rRNA (cytidine(1402)-2'-O)-methyltransferase [Amphibacillus sediminis]